MSPFRPPPPPDAAARMQAAVAAERRGDHGAAEARFRALTAEWPRFAEAWHYYGLALYRRGAGAAAAEALARARELDPDNLVLLLNSGRCLRELGRLEDSIACLERARTLDPDHVRVLLSLAQSLLAAGRGEALIGEIEDRLRGAGQDWRRWMALGRLREQARDLPGALAAFREAARLAPREEVEPRWRRAETARECGRDEEARAGFEALLEASPEAPDALWGLAHLAARAGDFPRARYLLRRALARNPDLYGAWELLSSIGSAVPPEEALPAELNAAAARAGDDPAAWRLHFARGRVLERLGEYDQAFAAYARGNRLRRIPQPYSREKQLAYTRNILANLNRAFLGRRLGTLSPAPEVIFICGMPRSGTTLVEAILAAHPQVRAGGELSHVHDYLRRRLGTANMEQTGVWLGAAGEETLRDLAVEWREHMREQAQGHARVTDKLPANYRILALIRLCFPSARIVHVSREARDNCFSCFATPFAQGHAYYSSLASTGHMYRLYRCFMAHWYAVLGPGEIIEIEYERLAREPDTEIPRLLAAVGLPWNPRCLDFHRHVARASSASLYQVRQPLYTGSIGRWRHFERHLGPLLAELRGPPP